MTARPRVVRLLAGGAAALGRLLGRDDDPAGDSTRRWRPDGPAAAGAASTPATPLPTPAGDWECVRCGRPHPANPPQCERCGHTVLDYVGGPAREPPGTGDASPERPSAAVVREVARCAGERPADLPPLYRAVEPTALDALVASVDSGGVAFHYGGYAVTVTADGRVLVDDGT